MVADQTGPLAKSNSTRQTFVFLSAAGFSSAWWVCGLGQKEGEKTWLDSHPGPQFQYHGGQNTFVA